MEIPVKFPNKENQQLFGVLHIPQASGKLDGFAPRSEGVIFVHSGASGRIGYGYQYVCYARRLCNEGFYVLRFDPHGMGDSEGYIPDCPWPSYWSVIQTGLYVDDVVIAIDFLTHSTENVQSITLVGLCAGAISSLLTAGKDKRVNNLILIGMPVLLDDPSIDYQRDRSVPKRSYVTKYVRKATSLESWKKFLIRKTEHQKLKLASIWLRKIKKSSDTSTSPNKNFNRYIPTSLMNFTNRRGRVLFIYGTKDSSWKEFQENKRYLSQNIQALVGAIHELPYQRGARGSAPRKEIYTIENANHLLAQKKWQDIAIEKIIAWLKEA